MSIEDLVGKKICSIDGCEEGGDDITFMCDDGSKYRMYHIQDCCEHVSVDKIVGDPERLIGNVVVEAIQSCPDDMPDVVDCESFTWTDFTIKTDVGIDVRFIWLGCSNGYYGEAPTFEEVK